MFGSLHLIPTIQYSSRKDRVVAHQEFSRLGKQESAVIHSGRSIWIPLPVLFDDLDAGLQEKRSRGC